MKGLQHFKAVMEKYKPFLVMVIIQFIYAGFSLFSKAAVTEGMKGSVFVFYRQAFATLVLAPFAFFCESEKSTRLTFKTLWKMIFVSLFGVTLSLNLFLIGMKYTSATFATAITNTIPVIVFIMAVCLRIESLSITQWHGLAKVLGSVIGISGAMVYTFYKGPPLYPESGRHFSHASTKVYTKEEWIKGSVLMLGANLAWCIWLIMQTPILKEYPSKLRITTLQCCFSCIFSGLYGAVKERDISSWKLGWDINLLSVAYCGIIVTGLSFWLQVWVVDKKGPVFTSIFSPLALILTAILSACILKETLHWGSVLAAVLLVAGLYSYLWGKNKESKTDAVEVKPNNPVKEEVALECIMCTTANNEEGNKKEVVINDH